MGMSSLTKSKILNGLLIFTSLFGYLEWGVTNHSFIFEVEIELLPKIVSEPYSIVHPFIIIPLVGQVLLLTTLFQNSYKPFISIIGMSCIGLLLLFLFLIGCMSLNYKIILFSFPYICVSLLVVHHFQTQKKQSFE